MKKSLSLKYTLLNVILIVFLVLSFTLFFVKQHNESYENQILYEAKNYLNILNSSVSELIVDYDFKRIRENVFFIKENPDIDYVYIFNDKGEIIADGSVWGDKLYQVPDDEFQSKAMAADSFLIQQNNSLFDFSAPIFLEQEKIGAIRLGYSKKDLYASNKEYIKTAIILDVIIILIGSLLAYLVILRISRPIKKIISLVKEITLGNLNKKISFSINDEIKELADSFNDMTSKLTEIRDSLIKAKEYAEKSDELKSEFLAQISHEIRTPINTMLNYATLIEEESNLSKDSDSKKYFKVMRNESRRIIRTIDLILNISEIQKGSYQPKFDRLNICKEIFEFLEKEFRFYSENKGLDFQIEKEYTNCEIYADQYTVTQIFQNLIDNSIKYTNEGSISVKIKNSKDKLIVTIKDTGIGISKEIQKKLLDFYNEEDKIYMRKFHGTGLGILLVQNYCKLNNAELAIRSEEGRGTEVDVIFKILT